MCVDEKSQRTLDREPPAELNLHLIVDDYRTHTHANVDAWLERHPSWAARNYARLARKVFGDRAARQMTERATASGSLR